MVLNNRDGKPTVFAQDRKVFKLRADLFRIPPQPVARMQLPRSGSARSASFRRDLAARLVALDVRPPRSEPGVVDERAEARAESLDAKAREHPCHRCPEREKHERWAARASRLEREIAGLERRIRTRTETLARQFDRVLSVLEDLGYVEGFTLTDRGATLARIYGEADVVVAEMTADGLLAGLSPAEGAALVSTLVYESRERTPRAPSFPTAELAARYRRLQDVWRRVRRAEEDRSVELTRELDAGFVAAAFHWGEGKPLEDVLAETAMAPGDFVRTCKQLLDLLRQIEEVAPGDAATVAVEARTAVNRGVVAYTGL